MKPIRSVVAALLFAIACNGCASKNVLYRDAERRQDATALFLDREGSLYPAASVAVPVKQMLEGARPSSAEFATLRHLYQQSAVPGAASAEAWRSLLADTGVTPDAAFTDTWQQIQQVLRARASQQLDRAAEDGRVVVLLVHGYNNDYREAAAWYERVERDFRERGAASGQALSFVRVYWDGLHGNAFRIWGAAQLNGPYVGLELRRVLAGVDNTDMPLRVFTHSSGAYVMNNALGNGSSPLRGMQDAYYRRAAGLDGYGFPPLRNLRMAMLVPAQPPTAMANYHHPRLEQTFGTIPDRLILGLSRHDFATGKGRRLGSCRMAGNTCMATHIRYSCAAVRRDLRSSESHGRKQVWAVAFPQPALKSHPHPVASYMQDGDWKLFADALLLDTALEPANQAALCERRVGPLKHSDAWPDEIKVRAATAPERAAEADAGWHWWNYWLSSSLPVE
ncbi:hypothetical protein [Stenotrophomonas maltophilia]|uniref:hypothetical protein n=1 Tax=Stenotrophomonas maltophilia TaxID=40324 RepID=UPI0024028CA3|nr:hypothetical protein [Stenotrophomonas maltophilia]